MKNLKYVKLFENFKVNESYMRGGGPEKVLYIYGDAKKNAMGKEVMDSYTSYYYKETNQNKDAETINKMKNIVKKSCEEKGRKEFSNEIQQAYAMDYFTNTHSGAILFIRFLDRNNKPIITDVPDFIVDGWILPSFYGEGEYKFGIYGKEGGFIDETELELLVKSQNIPDANGLSKALKELRYNISGITSKGVITTKNENSHL